MKAIGLIFCFWVITLPANAISVEDLIKKVNGNYENAARISYNATYELYRGHSTTSVHTSYQGFVYKSGNQVYQKIDQTETISSKDFFLKISHSQKAMELDLPINATQNELDLSAVLQNCKEKSVEDKGDFYRVKLVYNAISQTPISVLYFRVRKSDFALLQMDMYYASMQDFSETRGVTDMAKPHMKIRFKDISTSPEVQSELFSLSNYLKKENNFLNPTGSCQGYHLIDNRLN